MTHLQEFLQKNNISNETWEAADISWDALEKIGLAYTEKVSDFRSAAEYFSNTIQQFKEVHSVRWRIKDVSHLLEKIVRKRAEKVEKYLKIDHANFSLIVTDLIGIRAIHLFKNDFEKIDFDIRAKWDTSEKPVVYLREGDSKSCHIQDASLFDIKYHSFGYRSIHYLIESTPSKTKYIAELQVRTIFEEGWSEIDHRLRYPNFSDNEHIKSILTIFNRLAGSADEIATFALTLQNALTEFSKKQQADAQENSQLLIRLTELENTLAELAKSSPEKQSRSTELVTKAQTEIVELKKSQQHPQVIRKERQPNGNDAGGLIAVLAGLALLNALSKN